MMRILAILLAFLAAGPAPAQDQPLRFAFLSDTHIGGSTAQEDLLRVVEDINGRPDISFVIITGDITEMGSDAEFREAREALDRLERPWYIIPGNHDTKWSESGTTSFETIFGMDRFAFEAGGYLFVGCSSGPDMRMGPGMVPREHVVWLDSLTASTAASRKPLIFLNHYPLDEGLLNWYEVIDLLKRTNVQATLCGHGHRNRAFEVEGIPAIMGRSTLQGRSRGAGYNLVSISADSLSFVERIPETGTEERWHAVPLGDHDFAADTTSYARPSYAVNEQYPEVREVWSFQDDANVGAGVAVAGNVAVVADTRGRVMALDAATGARLWTFEADGKVFSTPAIAADAVVVASTGGKIYCLDLRTGAVNWMWATDKPIVASPVIDDGVIYIGSSEGTFRALSLDDGSERWKYEGVEGFVETRPTLDHRHVYFGAWDGHFYALSRETGELAWRWTGPQTGVLYSPAAVLPVTSHGKVFIVAPDRHVTALDAATGGEIWRANLRGRESLGMSEDGSTVFVKTMQDTVYAVSATADHLAIDWTSHAGFGYEISPASTAERDGLVFVPAQHGEIYALDAADGRVVWVHKVTHALINNIVPLPGGELITSTLDGKVVKLGFVE